MALTLIHSISSQNSLTYRVVAGFLEADETAALSLKLI